ncbi:GNAT family N-acetyltransferase [Paramicrobacterium agarici]|uniref:GNAT family N-acetyltransferase n=1 Tax=Paramicrobacterium agarici TaxID=630514 RepID=UPI001153C4B4|nr:GNAT family protein [Microbacterium agarici]TQO22354.1 RimJ/RimL family protein N-acetyltransferase [Microbacterium agarici]
MITLRPWKLSDAAALLECIATSPDLVRQVGTADVSTVESCRAFIRDALPAEASTVNVAACIDDVPVGNVGISNIEYRHSTGWTYYWLAVRARGQGIATRALATIAQWAFTEQSIHRLELGHRVDNPASCHVAARAGFAPEGIQREKLRYGTERYDVETHARLATDAVPAIDPLPLDL